MLKKDVTYEDLDGNQVTDTLYFNYTETELVQIEAKYGKGLQQQINMMIESEDNRQILEIFKEIVLGAYGQRTADGKSFIKRPEMREEFEHTLAFDAMFIELATNTETISKFITNVVPKKMAGQVAQAIAEQEPLGRRTPPTEIPNQTSEAPSGVQSAAAFPPPHTHH